MAAGFLGDYQDEAIAAAITLAVAIALAKLIDRTLQRRTVAEAVAGRELSPVADTRLRLIRRLTFALVIVVGIGLALGQFPVVRQVATGLLASSALLGLVVGFAARQTLANAIAGVMLALSQPVRIGDRVTVDDETGEVEDVRLTYTHLRLDDGRRLIIPNEHLAQTPVSNHTVVDPHVEVEVSVWIAPGADSQAALRALREIDDAETRVAEVDKEGTRLALTTWTSDARSRGRIAADLRERALGRLEALTR